MIENNYDQFRSYWRSISNIPISINDHGIKIKENSRKKALLKFSTPN